MKINRKTHLEIRLQNLLFSLLFLVAVGLLAWLSTRYHTQFDWTASHRHTLSEASRKVLGLIKGPVTVTAYARENQQLREQIRDAVDRYSRFKPDLKLEFVNPDTQPDRVRELGITLDGELAINYQGRTEKVQEAGESQLTNALQRLASAAERHIVFLEGHGERSPKGQANHDLKQFADELERKGMTISMINLAMTTAIPDNTDVLVIAGPKTKLMSGEVELIDAYVKRGGNLWWLADPGDLFGLAPLAQQLGIKFLPGMVVDTAATQLLGIADPAFALVVEYPSHPISKGFEEMTLFPMTAAIEKIPGSGFEQEILLSTLPRSWTETGRIDANIRLDTKQGERQGPLDIALALTRQVTPPAPAPLTDAKTDKAAETSPSTANPDTGEATKPAEVKPVAQRIVVIGDGDFLSNSFLGNGGNLNLGINMIQWLSGGDEFVNIPAKASPDQKLELSSIAMIAIAVSFLIILPLLLFAAGAWIWFRRRRS